MAGKKGLISLHQVHRQDVLGLVRDPIAEHIAAHTPNEVSGILSLSGIEARVMRQRAGVPGSVVLFEIGDLVDVYLSDAEEFVVYHSHPKSRSKMSNPDIGNSKKIEQILVILANFSGIDRDFLKTTTMRDIYDWAKLECAERIAANPHRRKKVYHVLAYEDEELQLLMFQAKGNNPDAVMHRKSGINILRQKIGSRIPRFSLPLQDDQAALAFGVGYQCAKCGAINEFYSTNYVPALMDDHEKRFGSEPDEIEAILHCPVCRNKNHISLFEIMPEQVRAYAAFLPNTARYFER